MLAQYCLKDPSWCRRAFRRSQVYSRALHNIAQYSSVANNTSANSQTRQVTAVNPSLLDSHTTELISRRLYGVSELPYSLYRTTVLYPPRSLATYYSKSSQTRLYSSSGLSYSKYCSANCDILAAPVGGSRNYHTSRVLFEVNSPPPSSQVEVTVNALKEEIKQKSLDKAEEISKKLTEEQVIPIHPPKSPRKTTVITKDKQTKASTVVSADGKVTGIQKSQSDGVWNHRWMKVIRHELKHYWHGTKLLAMDTKIASRYVWRMMKGETLSRRERLQLIRTTGDLFRLVPFSVFLLVPFMELALPFAIKLFPGMLPSTFETADQRADKIKKSLKIKLEMAGLLRETLGSMAVQSKGHNSKAVGELTDFFEQVERSEKSAEFVSTSEILRHSKLFTDRITLDSLSRDQLKALCRLLEMPALGVSEYMRFQLTNKLHSLRADDMKIKAEGFEGLSTWELQQACRSRGMRSMGMSNERLRRQLEQWITLSLDEKVPCTLLLFSRLLYVTDMTPASLAGTMSHMPEEVKTRTKSSAGKVEGKVDNVTRYRIISEEEAIIAEERKASEALLAEEKKAVETLKKEEEVKEVEEIGLGEADLVGSATLHSSGSPALDKTAKPSIATVTPTPIAVTSVDKTPTLVDTTPLHVDKAPVLEDRAPLMVDKAPGLVDTSETGEKAAEPMNEEEEKKNVKLLSRDDLVHVEEAVEVLGAKSRHMLVEELSLADIKRDLRDYSEDLTQFRTEISRHPERADMKESKAARNLFLYINRIVKQSEPLVKAIAEKTKAMEQEIESGDGRDKDRATLVRLEDVASYLHSVMRVSDTAKVTVICETLAQMDTDNDGAVKMEHLLKVISRLTEYEVDVPRPLFEAMVRAMLEEEEVETHHVVQDAVVEAAEDLLVSEEDRQDALTLRSRLLKEFPLKDLPVDGLEGLPLKGLPVDALEKSPLKDVPVEVLKKGKKPPTKEA